MNPIVKQINQTYQRKRVSSVRKTMEYNWKENKTN